MPRRWPRPRRRVDRPGIGLVDPGELPLVVAHPQRHAAPRRAARAWPAPRPADAACCVLQVQQLQPVAGHVADAQHGAAHHGTSLGLHDAPADGRSVMRKPSPRFFSRSTAASMDWACAAGSQLPKASTRAVRVTVRQQGQVPSISGSPAGPPQATMICGSAASRMSARSLPGAQAGSSRRGSASSRSVQRRRWLEVDHRGRGAKMTGP